MGDRSKIEWTEATWNPVTGCSKVSPGCAHCYAERIELRFGRSTKPWTPENAAENVRLHPGRLDEPLRWRKPRMVFVCSMADLFHEHVPDEFQRRVFDVMAAAPQHTFQVLTKRPAEAFSFLALYYDRVTTEGSYTVEPLPNVWIGVSIENARHTWRADVLRDIPAAVRFISAEPLLGSLLDSDDRKTCPECDELLYMGHDPECSAPIVRRAEPLDLTGIDWVIAGGESGPGARPMHPDWARELRDATRCGACLGDGRGGDYLGVTCDTCCGSGVQTAFFFKQWGGLRPTSGGRLLDGREWNELPLARASAFAIASGY